MTDFDVVVVATKDVAAAAESNVDVKAYVSIVVAAASIAGAKDDA